MRRSLVCIAFALVSTLPVVSQAAEANPVVGTLGIGDSAFWDQSVATTSGTQTVTRRFILVLAVGGQTLRVGLNGAPDNDNTTITVRDPGGVTRFNGGFSYNSGETFADNPATGTWSITVASPAGRAYRMRARLEGAPGPNPVPAESMLPNLQLIPPYEFTLTKADFSINGTSPTGSCTADDIVQFGARRCLRFSAGPANVGVGPFHVRFTPLEGLVTEGQAYQIVYDSDGNTTERPAGTFLYHKTHKHYHHTGFGSLELLAVDAQTQTMTPVGAGPKQGFCTADIVMYDFDRFTQPREGVPSECDSEAGFFITGPIGTQMAISPGWADIYVYAQDGNYVEFGDNGDGRYVVRSTADAMEWILESDETDNTSYAYVEITGTEITVLERGFGSGPFDPHRRVATDNYPGNA